MKNLMAYSALLVLAMASISLAWNPPATGQQDVEKMTKTLNLTDDQAKKIKDNEDARTKALAEVTAAMQANNTAVQDAIKGDDTDKRNKLFEENRKLAQQYQEITKKYDDAKLAVLSDEQKAKFADAQAAEQTDAAAKMQTQYLQGMTKVCGLSDDQVKSIVAIKMAMGAAIGQYGKDNAEALAANWNAIRQAMKDNDTDKLAALAAESAKLQAPVMEFNKKSEQDTMAILTDDQRAKWIEHAVMESFFSQVALFELTDDQKSKVKEAVKPLAAEKGATIESVQKKLMEKLFADILTKEQKAKWLKSTTTKMVEFSFFSAKLTDDQKAGIKQDYDKLVADETTAPDIASAKDMDGLYKLSAGIVKKLLPLAQDRLTDEQKKAMEKTGKPGASPFSIPAGGAGGPGDAKSVK